MYLCNSKADKSDIPHSNSLWVKTHNYYTTWLKKKKKKKEKKKEKKKKKKKKRQYINILSQEKNK